MSRLRNIQNTLDRWGFARWFWSALMRTIRPWFFLARLQRIPLERNHDHAHDDIVIRKATRDELLQAAIELPTEMDPEFIEAALERGDLGTAAFDGDLLVGFIWAAFSQAPHDDGLWVSIEAPYVYGYKSFVREAYRGRRLLSRLAYARDQMCLAQGRFANVGFVETHNFASHRAGLHAGADDIGLVGYVRLFGKSYPFRTPTAARTTFRFYRLDD